MSRGRRFALGALVLLVWAWHSLDHVLDGHPGDALWSCIVGELLVGVGLLATQPRAVALGTLWLLFGLPLFFIALAAGEPKTIASWVTHLFGPLAAVLAVRGCGFPAGTWWRASLALLALQGLCRLVTPPELDVNLAFAIHPGWEGMFSDWIVYELFMVTIAIASFALCEVLLRRFVAAREPAPIAAPAPAVSADAATGARA